MGLLVDRQREPVRQFERLEQPIAIDLAHAARGFREALPLLHAGEKAVVWMPPRPGTLEPVAYEVELVEVVASRPGGTGA